MSKCICCGGNGETSVFGYDLCRKCGILCRMVMEGVIKSHNREFMVKEAVVETGEAKKKDMKTVVDGKSRLKCTGCELSFVDRKGRRVSCVDGLEPGTCRMGD